MPDLGRYAAEVLLAYGVGLGLIGALVWVTLAQGRAARKAAQAEEARDDAARRT